MVPTSSSQDYPIEPNSFIKVQINDDFWSKRINTHREITLPYVLRKCETTRRIANFSMAAGLIEKKLTSLSPFDDSDLPGVEEIKTQIVLDRIKDDHTIIIP